MGDIMRDSRPFTVAELGKRWTCSPDAIYALIRRGRLPAFRVGGKLLRIKAEDVAKWESIGVNIDPANMSSDSSMAKRLQYGGATMEGAIDTGSASTRKERADLRLMRSLVTERR